MTTAKAQNFAVARLLYSLSAYGINKCVAGQGNVSFQDKPCKTDQQAEALPSEIHPRTV